MHSRPLGFLSGSEVAAAVCCAAVYLQREREREREREGEREGRMCEDVK